MYINHDTIRAALDKAPFPASVRDFLSEGWFLSVSRHPGTKLPMLREGGPGSRPLWQSDQVCEYVRRKYNRAAPLAVTAFCRALDDLCAADRIEKANNRDRHRTKK